VALAALHHGTAHSAPAFAICGRVTFRKMKIGLRHAQFLADSTEAHFAIRALERERMRHRNFTTGFRIEPFVHAPEVSGAEVEVEFVDEARDQRQLFGWPDGTADADRIVLGGLLP